MAGIIYNTPTANLNPTDGHLPVRIGNQFLDSSFFQEGDFQNASYVNTVDNNGTPYGFKMQPAISQTLLGDFDGIGSGAFIDIKSDTIQPAIEINGVKGVEINALDSALGLVYLNATDQIRFTSKQFRFQGTSITQATSGGSAGLHLKVNVNGTNYLIRLENP
jgi:hypothetical protein